jgi:hypothetical protein
VGYVCGPGHQVAIAHRLWHTLHATPNWRPPEAIGGNTTIQARVGIFGADYMSEGRQPTTGNMSNPARFLDPENKEKRRPAYVAPGARVWFARMSHGVPSVEAVCAV